MKKEEVYASIVPVWQNVQSGCLLLNEFWQEVGNFQTEPHLSNLLPIYREKSAEFLSDLYNCTYFAGYSS